jgi:tyrosyl-tRNA synthetase
MGQRPQQVFLVPLLVGTDGSQKMSKSLGNYIGVDDLPNDVYGKVMSIPDDLIMPYFELLTDVPDMELEEMRRQLGSQSVNPMLVKKSLASELVAQFHGDEAARGAEEHFTRLFQKREGPKEIHLELQETIGIRDTVTVEVQRDIVSLIFDAKLAESRSEAKRLLEQGAIDVDGQTLTGTRVALKDGSLIKVDTVDTLKDGSIIKVGKRRSLRIIDANKRTWEIIES